MASVIKAAVGDAVLTFMWIFCASSLGAATAVVSSALGVQGLLWPSLFITTVLIFLIIVVFTIIGDFLGGANFNPTASAAFYVVGLGSDTLFSMALRFPAQALGAVAGVLVLKEVMPVQYKHMLGGPSLKVDLHTGAIAEGVLTFLMTFAVLVIMLKGPRSSLLKMWLLAIATMTLVVAGSSYSGPSMNPVNHVGSIKGRHETQSFTRQVTIKGLTPNHVGANNCSMEFHDDFIFELGPAK